MSFQALGLSPELVRAVTEQNYSTPTPIQVQAIPLILAGRDLLAGAQTGTGKTAGFTLPMLQRLARKMSDKDSKHARPVRALILTPTRELAAQLDSSVKTYSKYLTLRSTVVFGGVNIRPQIDKLRRGVDIVVATPGRLLDLVNQRAINLSAVEVLVLDEADRMLDMGFIHAIRDIVSLLPKKRQSMLFSATFSSEVKKLADHFLHSAAKIQVAQQNMAADSVSQWAIAVDQKRKAELLSHLIGSENWQQVLVFTRTKHGADRLTKQLIIDGLSATAIHGNKSQGARTRALAEFKSGEVRVLVATDVAARGLDIVQLPHVVNFDLPNVPEDYVHRIGRTGRAGNVGEAVSLVSIDEHYLLKNIERLLNTRIEQKIIPGYKPDPSIKAQPIQNGRVKQYPQKTGQHQQRRQNDWGNKSRNGNSARGKSKAH